MNFPAMHRLIVPAICLGLGIGAHADDKINFEDHIKPIFRAKCASCHNTNKKTADLDLSNYTAMMQGGGSGAAIEPGSPDDSYLFMVINHDSEPYMPPNADRIPDEMIQTVRKWIEIGAPETSSSKVMLPKKQNVSLSVDVSAGARPEGPAPVPDVLGLEPVVHTSAATAVSAIATSPWAKLVAVAGQKQVVLYSSETLQPLGVLPFPEGQARVLKFSRNGGLLLAGGGHGAAKGLAVVWNVRTGERVMQVGDELDEVLAADISADQSLIALGGPGKIVRVYNTATGELAYEIVKHTDWIYSLEFSPDSVLLATSDRTGGLHVWEAYTGREYLTLNGHKGGVTAVSWRIDSNVLASASEDASVKLWEMENGGNIKSWNAHGGGTLSMEFCRDGRIVTCGRDKVAKIWDQNGGEQRKFEAFADLALQVSHCDESDRVIAGDWTGEVRVWNAADGARIGNLTTNPVPLETRLAQAESRVEPANQKLSETRKGLEAATAARNAHLQVIETARQNLAVSQKAHADLLAAVKANEAQLAAKQKVQQDTQVRLGKLQQALPQLTSAAEKAGAASSMMQEDTELKKAVEALKAQVAQRTTEMQKTDAELKALTEEVAKYNQTIATVTQQAATAEQTAKAQEAELEKQTAALKPYDEKLAAAQAQLNADQETANAARAEVERWKQYIALRDELQQLREKKAAKDEVLLASLEAEAMLKEKQQQIQEQQQQIMEKAKTITEAQTKITDLNMVVAAAEKEMTVVKDSAAKHEQALPMLQAAVQQVKAASSMLPADAEVKSSAEALEKAAAAKAVALQQLKEQLVAVEKKMQDSKAALVDVTKRLSAAQTEMSSMEATAQKLSAEAAPVQKQVEEARAKLAVAEQELARVQALVDARKEKLRPQLQITQAANN